MTRRRTPAWLQSRQHQPPHTMPPHTPRHQAHQAHQTNKTNTHSRTQQRKHSNTRTRTRTRNSKHKYDHRKQPPQAPTNQAGVHPWPGHGMVTGPLHGKHSRHHARHTPHRHHHHHTHYTPRTPQHTRQHTRRHTRQYGRGRTRRWSPARKGVGGHWHRVRQASPRPETDQTARNRTTT